MYIGRFAPSPTGPLHMGSIMAAVASYCQAKKSGGKWLVRMEDLDPPREIPGAADDILFTLDHMGFEWDETIAYQSQRYNYYIDAIEQFKKDDLIYYCECSRSEIQQSGSMTTFGIRYNGTCSNKKLAAGNNRSVRIRVANETISFHDAIQGHYSQSLKTDIGDFVLRRRDQLFAYQLAVVIDDAEQSITEVVRGSDLLDSTPRQIWLHQVLQQPIPDYMHIPILVNSENEKLSKQTYAKAIQTNQQSAVLFQALVYLQQSPPHELITMQTDDIWQWAIANWQTETLKGRLTIRSDEQEQTL